MNLVRYVLLRVLAAGAVWGFAAVVAGCGSDDTADSAADLSQRNSDCPERSEVQVLDATTGLRSQQRRLGARPIA